MGRPPRVELADECRHMRFRASRPSTGHAGGPSGPPAPPGCDADCGSRGYLAFEDVTPSSTEASHAGSCEVRSLEKQGACWETSGVPHCPQGAHVAETDPFRAWLGWRDRLRRDLSQVRRSRAWIATGW
jgi:hypothetical protein